MYLCGLNTFDCMRFNRIVTIIFSLVLYINFASAQFLPKNQDQTGQDIQQSGFKQEATATDKSTGTDTLRILSFKLKGILFEKDSAVFDSVTYNFQNNSLPERLTTIAGSHHGSFATPFISHIYADRTNKSSFLFMKPYEHWIKYPEDFIFVNTTKLYSNIKYLTTTGDDKSQEEDFQFTFTGNLNKKFNIGADYEILYSRGYYNRSSSRSKLANIFSNYISPKYEAFFKTSFNFIEHFENGGITDDRYITQPLLMSGGLKEYESLNIPVFLSDARSLINNQQVFLNHKYNIGFNRKNKQDTLKTEFVPVTSITHTLMIDRNRKSYYSKSVNRQYYDSAYISNKYTADSSAVLNIRNTLGITLKEGFHEWAKMGLSGFIEHDFSKYSYYSPTAELKDTTNVFSGISHKNESNIWAGGELFKRQGSILTYSALAKICVLGDYIGDFNIEGDINTEFKIFNKPVYLNAKGFLRNSNPDFFIKNYYSNHFIWNNDFKNEYITKLSGNLDIPALGFKFKLMVENLTNHVYFNNSALPEQIDGSTQVLSANLNQKLRLGILHWDNDIVYQVSSDNLRLPLPTLSIYSNLYIKTILSKVLTTYLGVDCRYFSEYYANSYMPATGQFYTQQNVKIGNYPYMNAYGNFHLKRMRFFVMYSHLSRFFADPNYFSTPHYPLNPAALRVGLSWNFYD